MSNDTDGDGIPDDYELTQATLPNATGLPSWSIYNKTWIAKINATYGTNATNPDTDKDFIPDGAELKFYFNKTKYGLNMTLDPLNPDQLDKNGNFVPGGDGIPDGLELDSDSDGLPDGYEFMGMNTTQYNFTSTFITPSTRGESGGGALNPDSDYDGIPDGMEVYVLGTSPTSNDTDHDGFSDGLEERIGTDPLTPTSWTEFSSAMSSYKDVHIATPMSLSYIGKIVPVRIDAPSNTKEVTYKLYNGQSNSWSKEVKLNYDPSQDSWILPQEFLKLNDGNYYFKTYMYLNDGQVLTEGLSFAVNAPLKIFNFSNTSSGTNKITEFFAFTGFFSIGLMSSVIAINRKRIKSKMTKILTKRKEDQNQ